MDEQQIRKIVKDEMEQNYRSGSPRIPPHQHNGNDNLKISSGNIIPSIVGNATIISVESEIFTIKTIQNPSTVMFNGWAANNAGGGGATLKALITGSAQLGPGYNFISFSNSLLVPGKKVNIIQGCNSIYIDTTNLANTRVALDSGDLVMVTDGTNQVAKATVLSYGNNSVTIQTVLSTNWQIQGVFTIL